MINRAAIKYALAAGALFAQLLILGACQRNTGTENPPKLSQLPAEPAATQPTEQARKEIPPPNVKVKRDKDGVYTWDISGKDVSAIIEADRTLRRRFAPHPDREQP
jgi:hypothetical protein